MPKLMKNSSTNRSREGVGKASLLNSEKDKWRMSCHRKGTPRELRRKIVYGVQAVEKHFDTIEALLREHGRNKDAILNEINMDELTLCVRRLISFNSEANAIHTMEEVIDKGIGAIKAQQKRMQYPTLNELIELYEKHRATPHGNHRGNWVIDKGSLRTEKTFLGALSKIKCKYRLSDIFNPKSQFKQEAKKWILREWGHLSPKSQQDRAKTLRMLLDYAKELYPTLLYPNPLDGWDGYFNKACKSSGIKTILPVETVRDLFLRAANHPEWSLNIPFIALSLFAGNRPFDVASTKCASRRWRWEWFSQWKNMSAISEGYKACVPAWLPDGTKGSSKKTSVAQERDLTANGFSWIKWYYGNVAKESVPTVGKIPYSVTYWNALRKDLNLYGDNWDHDIMRRTFATYAHNHWINEPQYWCTHCGHDIKTYEKYYKGKTNHLEAEQFFSITPTSLGLCKNEELGEGNKMLVAAL
jgi:hypothetical protein